MNLTKISDEIKEVISNRQKELQLTFVEDKHIYYMKDTDGKIKSNFPSVSKVIKKFFKQFDAEGTALRMSNGDPIEAKKLQEQWREAGSNSTNMGSRVHYMLEFELVKRYGNYKDVRTPIYECDETQIYKGDNMVAAGNKFLDLMEERGAILLDTEMVLGDPELGYTGQPDKFWLMENKYKTGYGLVVTDWKTNQPKNFEVQHYTGKLYSPFQNYHDTALGHYYLQLPLYARLFLKMLKGTKFEDLKLLGCVVVLLKDDATFVEYRVPQDINNKIFELDLTKYIKR